MSMPMTLKEYLRTCDIDYEELPHQRETTTSRIAQRAHVTGDRMAKAVMVHGDSGYRVAVVPSSCDADLEQLSR
uniref:hypothetical protein n=1 Tax=Staphylococcus aureus TaxID=1280 RepID=UPI00301CDBA5